MIPCVSSRFSLFKLEKMKFEDEISDDLWVVYIRGSHVSVADFHFSIKNKDKDR